MATMTETPGAVAENTPSHEYHAEADVLSGELKRPIEQKIEQQAPVALKDRRGGHLTRFAEDVSIEGLISFKTGLTRVSGSRSLKHQGWVTLSTSIMEGLNVFEVITADRVVSQLSTDHEYKNGHVPSVTFLGTQFHNLQISGFPIKLTLDLGICSEKPEGDQPYVVDAGFLRGVLDQTEPMAKSNDLPKDVRDKYDERLAYLHQLISTSKAGRKGIDEPIKVKCSLVKSIDIDHIPIPGLKAVGNMLVIPHFGTVSLAEVEVGAEPMTDSPKGSNYFTLKMLKMKLGCIGHGSVTAGTTTANGHTRP